MYVRERPLPLIREKLTATEWLLKYGLEELAEDFKHFGIETGDEIMELSVDDIETLATEKGWKVHFFLDIFFFKNGTLEDVLFSSGKVLNSIYIYISSIVKNFRKF